MTNYNILFEEIIQKISDQVTDNIIKAISPSTIPVEDAFLNIDDTAKLIDLAKPTVYGLVHQNKIPYHKKSKRLYFLKSEILDWIKSGKQESKSELEIRANDYLSKNRLF
jgi:predicted DNA-binding transcriptional regulator AlpA